MATVAETVTEIIARGLSRPVDELHLNDNLRDAGMESIDALEMIFDLEEEFGVQIPYNANQDEFATIADVAHMIEGLLAQKNVRDGDGSIAAAGVDGQKGR